MAQDAPARRRRSADTESPGGTTVTRTRKRAPLLLPAVPLADVVVLPQMIVPLHLDSWSHVRAVEMALLGDRQIFLLPRAAEGDTTDDFSPGRIGLVATVEESRPSRRG